MTHRGGRGRCFNISFIHWALSGRKRSGFSMGALSGTSCSGDDQGPSPFGSAARAKIAALQLHSASQIELESFCEAGSSSAGRNPDFDIGSLHIKKH